MLSVATIGAALYYGRGLSSNHADASAQSSDSAGAAASSSTAGTAAASSTAAASTPAHQAQSAARAAKMAKNASATASATTALSTLAAGQPSGAISVSVVNLSTKATFSWGATSGMMTASVVKVDILETLLLQHQQNGTPLSADEQSNAVAMIEESDNDAADWLWNDVGSDGAVSQANQTFGLTSTVAGTDDYWGETTTSAADQVTLLKELVGTSALNATSQAYALGLMRSVDPDQAWGVSAVADAGTTTALKNGWLSIDDDDGLWAVNSVGLVTVNGQQLAVAIMTQHQSDEDSGISLVQKLAAATVLAVS